MRRVLNSLRMAFRSRVKSIILLLLLIVISFGFFTQIANYWVTRREINFAAKNYSGVGAVEVSPSSALKNPNGFVTGPLYIWTDSRVTTGIEPLNEKNSYTKYQTISKHQRELIANLPYVTYTEVRYLTAGVSDRFERQSTNLFYDFTSRNILECTLEDVITEQNIGDYPAQFYIETRTELFNRLNVRIINRLAGHAEWQMDDEVFCIQANPRRYTTGEIITQIPCTLYTEYYTYDTDFVRNLVPGHRYVFVTRDMLSWHDQNLKVTGDYYNFLLGDHFSDTWCSSVWDITNYGEDYLDQPEFANLKDLVQMTNDDVHTWDVVYTNDMTSILRFAEGRMVIIEGRAITPQDSGKNVCVINRVLANAYNLNVGDKLDLALGKCLFEQYAELGAVACVPERFDTGRTETTLEIVGVYADTDGLSTWQEEPNWVYSQSTVFVPQSLLNVHADEAEKHEPAPGEFSFKVDNPWEISKFMEVSAPLIQEMGLKLYFEDGGWSAVESSFRTAKTVTLIRMLLALVVLLIATIVSVYLYIGRRKKEYAIMRAFGARKGAAKTAMLVPLGALTVTAVIIGMVTSWLYTSKELIPNSKVLESVVRNTSDVKVPVGLVIGCIAFEILLTMVTAGVLIGILSRKGLLTLLKDKTTIR